MCGIFGVYNKKLEIDKKKVEESTRLLEHRGPDGEGYYYDDINGVALGHRRLSIIDIAGGRQPMTNEDNTIWITFNGEIYNFQEIKEDLIKKGHKFKTRCDTEVLIHGYEEYGKELPNKLNGIFAFCMWNKNRKELFLARDHFGVKPLYYYWDGNLFIFASELKSIIKYGEIKKEINENSLLKCLIFRYTPSPDTLFKKIYKLPAASYILMNENGFSTERYWKDKIAVNNELKESEWVEILENKLKKAINRQLISDVPVGLSLSSGVDSNMILALLNYNQKININTYTIAFEDNKIELNESIIAKERSDYYNCNHKSRIVTEKDYNKFFEKYLWHLEEPIGNESSLSYYFVAEMAKEDVKVLLNGQGSDELFGGYDRYLGLYYSEKYPLLIQLLNKIWNKFTIFDSNRQYQLKKLDEIVHLKTFGQKYLFTSSVLPINDLINILKKDFLFDINNESLYENSRAITHLDKNNENIENFFICDMFNTLSENLLLAEDKMNMAESIEARVPLLDIEFVKAALEIPVEFKIRKNSGKYILKKAAEKYLPKDMIYKKKIGFDTPMQKWMKQKTGEKLRDLINSENSISNNYLRKDEIIKMIKANNENKINYEKFLFLLLSLEMWREMFI